MNLNIDNTKFSIISKEKENHWLEAQYNYSRGRVAIVKNNREDSYWVTATYESYLMNFSVHPFTVTLEDVKETELTGIIKEFDELFYNLANSVSNIKNLTK